MQPLNDMQKAMKWYKKLDQSRLHNEAISKKEYHALLAVYPYGCMERIIWRFAWETGARPVEVSRLAKSNFSNDFRMCQFVAAKGRTKSKVRTCYLSEGFAKELVFYLSILISPANFLFPNRYHQKVVIAKNFLNQELGRRRHNLYKVTGNKRWIEKKDDKDYILHPYSFRYSLIKRLLEDGYSIPEVAQYMGHTKVNTTMQYARFMKCENFKRTAEIEPDITSTYVDPQQTGLNSFINQIQEIQKFDYLVS